MREQTIWAVIVVVWLSLIALWLGHAIYLDMDWDRAVAAGEIIPQPMPAF